MLWLTAVNEDVCRPIIAATARRLRYTIFVSDRCYRRHYIVRFDNVSNSIAVGDDRQ